jgi:subtilisin family serine protease
MRTPLALLVALLALLVCAPAALGAADPLRSQQWGLDLIEADAAHATSTGSGVVVAVIDSGVRASHEDLAGRLLLPGHDYIQNDATPQDENGHGTHVTGIVAATAGNGKGIEGVAPGARVMPIRVLDKNGEGDADVVAKGIDYAVAHGADVINLSLGSDAIGTILGGDDKFTKAVQNALNHGVVVVAAAGNETTPFCEQPAVSGPFLCVGAVDRDGIRSFYSSSGDLMAPGGSGLGGSDEDVLSTYNDGKYETIAGTSQAAPHVAGVAALIIARGLHGQAVVNRILATATDAGLAGPDGLYGAGIVNAKAAVAGLGGGGGGGGGGGVKPGLSYKHTQKISTVLKHGVKLRCSASVAGKCTVRVTARGKVIARGSRSFGGPGKGTATAKVTKAGRKMLRGVKKKLLANVAASVPGGGKRTGKLTLKR